MNLSMNDGELDSRIRDAVAADAVDTVALEQSIRVRIAQRPSRWPTYAALAAAAMAFAVLFFPRSAPKEFQDAARDHRLEVVEHRPRHWRSAPDNMPVSIPAGYQLEHAKICGIAGKPVWHLVFSDGAQEVSVYLTSAPSSHDVDVDGQHVRAFQSARLSGLVVGSAAECAKFVTSL